MVFGYENKILIKNLYLLKGYNAIAGRLLAEFPAKCLTKRSINGLLQKSRLTGAVDRGIGSAQTEERGSC